MREDLTPDRPGRGGESRRQRREHVMVTREGLRLQQEHRQGGQGLWAPQGCKQSGAACWKQVPPNGFTFLRGRQPGVAPGLLHNQRLMRIARLSLTLGSFRARAPSDLLRTQWAHQVRGAGVGG